MAKKGKKVFLDKNESLYSPKLIARAKEIIPLVQAIKTDGTPHYSKIAKLLNIPARTFSRWRNPESEYYKPEFAQALAQAHEEMVESIQLGLTKKATIARSQPYNKVKRTKELQLRGPVMPRFSKLKKAGLVKAAMKLGVKVEKKDTIAILKLKIAESVVDQTKEVLVVVKQEETRILGDGDAQKMVTANIGPKDKRWTDKVDVGIHVDGLSKLLEEIDGSGTRLPDQEKQIA